MCSNPQRSCWPLAHRNRKVLSRNHSDWFIQSCLPTFYFYLLKKRRRKKATAQCFIGRDRDVWHRARVSTAVAAASLYWTVVPLEKVRRRQKVLQRFFVFLILFFHFIFMTRERGSPAKRTGDVLVFTATRPLAVPPKTFYLLSPSPTAIH